MNSQASINVEKLEIKIKSSQFTEASRTTYLATSTDVRRPSGVALYRPCDYGFVPTLTANGANDTSHANGTPGNSLNMTLPYVITVLGNCNKDV